MVNNLNDDTSTNLLRCFGSNKDGSTDINAYESIDVKMLSAGNRHSCIIDIYYQLYCWGWNLYGQIDIEIED